MPAGKSLFDKVWDAHAVRELPDGQTQLFIGLHLIHEVTSPQAFAMLREMKLPVRFPRLTFATVDHIVPTDSPRRPFADTLAEEMLVHLERNCAEYGIQLYLPSSGKQGVVHVIGHQPKPSTPCAIWKATGPCGQSTSAPPPCSTGERPIRSCALAPQPCSAITVGCGPSPGGTWAV